MTTDLIEKIIIEYENLRGKLNDDGTIRSMFELAQDIQIGLNLEEIDEEKLNELAKSEAFIYGTCFADVSHSTMINRENGFYEGFKAGYCKAMEEKI